MGDVQGTGFDARRIDPRVRLAMRLMEFEQAHVPGVEALADRVGLSVFHLSRLFAAQVGETCAAYSRRIRLDHANNQMLHDPVPIGVVAETFGYESQAAFTRAYIRQFGLSPRQFVSRVLGRSPVDYVASELGFADPAAIDWPLLRGPVRMVRRPDRPALARRFYGHDLAGHWRRFLADLPAGLIDGGDLAGLAYDNARVTPPHRWRYDCAIVFDRAGQIRPALQGTIGLDPVEVPGGLHAESDGTGDFGALRRATIGLLAEWLPAHRDYRPEGDPIVHWFGSPPDAEPFPATATIRVYPRGGTPAYNMRPLTRHGRPAGERGASSGNPYSGGE